MPKPTRRSHPRLQEAISGWGRSLDFAALAEPVLDLFGRYARRWRGESSDHDQSATPTDVLDQLVDVLDAVCVVSDTGDRSALADLHVIALRILDASDADDGRRHVGREPNRLKVDEQALLAVLADYLADEMPDDYDPVKLARICAHVLSHYRGLSIDATTEQERERLIMKTLKACRSRTARGIAEAALNSVGLNVRFTSKDRVDRHRRASRVKRFKPRLAELLREPLSRKDSLDDIATFCVDKIIEAFTDLPTSRLSADERRQRVRAAFERVQLQTAEVLANAAFGALDTFGPRPP
jgi:hypothetical protein